MKRKRFNELRSNNIHSGTAVGAPDWARGSLQLHDRS